MIFDIEKFRKDMIAHRLKGRKTPLKEAGEEIGIGSSTVTNIEIGRAKDPSIEIVLRCCKWMGKEIDNYITG